MSDDARTAALAALVGAQATTTPTAEPVLPASTGVKVPAGGTVERVLLVAANLTYWETAAPAGHRYPKAAPGDTVLVTEKQATRLDALGVTLDPAGYALATGAAQAQAQDAPPAAGVLTLEQVQDLGAVEVVAYLEEHPDQAGVVLAAEEDRAPSQRRAKVLGKLEELGHPLPA